MSSSRDHGNESCFDHAGSHSRQSRPRYSNRLLRRNAGLVVGVHAFDTVVPIGTEKYSVVPYFLVNVAESIRENACDGYQLVAE